MGMYDYVKGHTRCGYCNSVNEVDQQIKFTNDPTMEVYILNDKIDACDGEYKKLSGVRSAEYKCDVCENNNDFVIVVKDGILTRIDTIQQPKEVKKETLNKLYVKRQEENKKRLIDMMGEEKYNQIYG